MENDGTRIFRHTSTSSEAEINTGATDGAEESLRAWIYEVRLPTWENANELKAKYGNASIISSKRVVFNIKGNDYRLIVDIEYKLKIVFVVWFGTHVAYDLINAKQAQTDLILMWTILITSMQ